ncbi:uncharacterized protein LOC128720552 [Anopheles nili]|uniref:uncharacterized protein LOC128720552 n=1 Tax=Anopheles nili TaxID=185578 RepID=UPI00237B0767|nr:uncharacterized protein LOC128720552 [Anopheles nili]
MSSTVKATNVEEVLPNDEDLGRRNCRWRELVKKYEQNALNQSNNSMDIDTAIGMLDQEMSNESSVSDVVEASSEEHSAEENPQEIERQLKVAVPLRQRQWESNGLKEILEDNEFRMLSHEKVENWLQNHMCSITGHYNVRYQTQQVTTVTETHMDADADSQYSVDTAQYIRSNKKISNKLKVTTMIKQYSVTSSVRQFSSLGVILDEPSADKQNNRLSHPLMRALAKSDSACDGKRALPRYSCVLPQRTTADRHERAAMVTEGPAESRRNRRKVFKKTIPRKRPAALAADRTISPQSSPVAAASKPRYDSELLYAKAMEHCAKMKKTKTPRRKVSKKFANRMYTTSTSSSSPSDSDEVFLGPAASREKPSVNRPAMQTVANSARTPTVCRSKTPSPNKASPTEREIVEPFQSITLNASKRQRLQPAGPDATACGSAKASKKRVGIQRDGCYHEEGVVIYRPSTIRPHLAASERINLRVDDLMLQGVTKQRHLAKFQQFNHRIHPNSTVCFYPSDSADSAEEAPNVTQGEMDHTGAGESYDDDDPILTFHPRHTKLLNVVEIPHRRNIA